MNKGFSLLEMSIGMVISALIFISFFGMYMKFTSEDQFFTTSQKIQTIEAALLHYTAFNKHLPCPARLNAQPNTSTFGTETDCTAAAPSGTTDVGTTNDAIRIGAIPIKALGLDDSFNYDGWKNRFTYVAVKNQSTTAASFKSFPVTGSNAILIRDKNGNQIHSNLDTSYIIISHGEKGIGATNLEGTYVKSCDASLESQNCNNDGVFIDSEYNPSSVAANYFDDIVKWSTRSQVIKKTSMAISLN